MALTDKLKNILNVIVETINPMTEEYPDGPEEDGYGVEYPVDGNAVPNPVFTELNQVRKNRSNIHVLQQARPGAHEVVVFEPKTFNESSAIASALKDKKTVILNLQLLDRELSQRTVDFVSGCTHALEGSYKKVGESVFIFTPSNINITQELTDSRLSTNALWTAKQ